MKNLKRITALFLSFCLLISVTVISASAADTEVTIELKGTYDYTEAYKVLDIVNQEREKNDLPALIMDTALLDAAMQRAAESSIYFNHTRPNGTTCFTAFPSKTENSYRGENIAAGQRSASAVMTSWMDSPGHKENILNSNFTSIGIGCFYQDGTLYWTQLFSSVRASSPSTRPTTKVVTASVSVLVEQLYLAWDIIDAAEPNEGQFVVYSLNTEFYEDPVLLENTTISYTSDNEDVLDITDSGLIKSASDGTAKLSCYIDGTLVFELELTFGHEHEYEAVVTPPTCTSSGYTTYTCTVCQDSYTDNETEPVPHDYTVTAIPNGLHYECKNCGHSYQETVTAPEKLPGDTDGDGKVSNSDLVAIARYIVGLELSIDFTAADIDKSGDITNSDLIAVARIIVGLE